MEDSDLTAHILVDCSKPKIRAPKAFIQQGKISLNIANSATNTLLISNESISFKARFAEKSENIFVPIEAVLSIYAGENGEGMFFEDQSVKKKTKRPNLTLLD
ncbi:MAG: stringent starvation protein B [Candidatus Thioglobus sp.]|nr:MAG: stringent starvation protein B [Candidatus Thioglobus sp.]KAA0451575.1 MAG: stringent starvation protein B [Candidatus Thioglobus sp.]